MSSTKDKNYFLAHVGKVRKAAATIESLDSSRLYDESWIERILIPELGLNDEALHEQPPELGSYFGKGLHLWQYPSQLASYLTWLSAHAENVSSYLEIGCRFGGMFILVSEWLKRIGAPLKYLGALDIIPPTPLVSEYIQYSNIPVIYINGSSHDPEVRKKVQRLNPSMVFIDGDHRLKGAMIDHATARKSATIIVHHDISSQSCPDTTFLWQYLKLTEESFEASEFTSQYESVNGSFLGIGVLKKR